MLSIRYPMILQPSEANSVDFFNVKPSDTDSKANQGLAMMGRVWLWLL
jgi:hypothetical protein